MKTIKVQMDDRLYAQIRDSAIHEDRTIPAQVRHLLGKKLPQNYPQIEEETSQKDAEIVERSPFKTGK